MEVVSKFTGFLLAPSAIWWRERGEGGANMPFARHDGVEAVDQSFAGDLLKEVAIAAKLEGLTDEIRIIVRSIGGNECRGKPCLYGFEYSRGSSRPEY